MTDTEKIRRMVTKAFEAIANGDPLDGVVYDHKDLGREMVIERALTYGGGLTEEFNDAEFNIVKRAFERFGSNPQSRSPCKCCADMLRIAS